MKVRDNRYLLIFVILLVMVAVDLALLRNVKEGDVIPYLPLAVALDFCLVLPVLYVLLSNRKKVIKWQLLPPLMLIGYVFSKLLLNTNGWEEEKLLAYLIIPLELIVVTYSISRIRFGIRAFSEVRRSGESVYDAMLQGVGNVFPQKSGVAYLIHELCMYYYLFFAWKKKERAVSYELPTFTYHKTNNMLILLIFLGFVLKMEGFAVHILVSQWSHTAAWLMTAGTVYVLLLFVADYRAMMLNPITVDNGKIKIRYGLRGFADISIQSITSIKAAPTMEIPQSEKKTAVLFGVNSQNVRLECAEPVDAIFMFGIRKSAKIIYLSLDEADQFEKHIVSLVDE